MFSFSWIIPKSIASGHIDLIAINPINAEGSDIDNFHFANSGENCLKQNQSCQY
jgi:hypothetical protein